MSHDNAQVSGMDPELTAMQTVLSALAGLDDDARARVVAWAIGRYDIRLAKRLALAEDDEDAEHTDDTGSTTPDTIGQFSTLGELYAAAQPKTNGEKALVAGYWLQAHGQSADLTSQAMNSELKHLGHGIANITAALDELKNEKPQLAIQIRKSGTSQQARKKYKLTGEGIKKVEAMVRDGRTA